MKTISVRIEDEVNAALAALCAEQRRDEPEVVAEVVRRYVEREGLKKSLQHPELAKLYEDLVAEDKRLSEQGMSEYEQMLQEADQG